MTAAAPRRRRKLAQQRSPRLHIATKHAPHTLNGVAADLLTQEGEMFAFVLIKDGKLVLQPLPAEPGLVGIVKLSRRPPGKSGAFIQIRPEELAAANVSPGEDLIGRWDDSEGFMVFEKGGEG